MRNALLCTVNFIQIIFKLPFPTPSLNGVGFICHNSSKIVMKRVTFLFEGFEEAFNECFFSKNKKQTVFSTRLSFQRQTDNKPAEIPIEVAFMMCSFTIQPSLASANT